MTEKLVDLRSDTVTRPTPSMRRAMAEAEVGDDVYGEDPTVNRLQEEAAALVGKEAAIFLPSGSMGNQVAVKIHTRPGEEVICEASSHIYNFEGAGLSSISNALARPVKGERGILDPDAVRAAVQPKIYYMARSSLLCLENTGNLAGGTTIPVRWCEELCRVARENGLATHLDGARIFNAAVAMGTDAACVAAPFDSVMFCISKGLCAPVGSLLAGSKDFIDEARRVRKVLGGGMRQAGVIAAAGIVAFREIIPLLAEDHRRAKALAATLGESHIFNLDPLSVETNIIVAEVRPPRTPQDIAGRLRGMGVLCSPATRTSIRFVTHHDITDEGISLAIGAVKKLCE